MELLQMSPLVRLSRLEKREKLRLVESGRRLEVTWIAVAPLSGNITTTLDERSDNLVLEGPLRRQFGHAARPGIGICPPTAALTKARPRSCKRSICRRIRARLLS